MTAAFLALYILPLLACIFVLAAFAYRDQQLPARSEIVDMWPIVTPVVNIFFAYEGLKLLTREAAWRDLLES